MSNLKKLVKINLLTFFEIYKIRNAKSFNEKRKAISKILIILFIFLYVCYVIYDMSFDLMKVFQVIASPSLVLGLFMATSCAFILLSNILKINGTLFNFKDYNLLLSLPIKRDIVILSKLINLYFANLIYTIILMLPASLAYLNFCKVDIIFHLLNTISILFMPIVPIVISTIIGTILTYFQTKFKHKNIGQLLVTLAFILCSMYFSFLTNNKTDMDIANAANSILNSAKKIYPLVITYLDIINNSSIVSLALFVITPFILFYIFIKILNNNFEKINSVLKNNRAKSKYKFKNTKTNTQLKALFIKEFKRYLSSPNCVINTGIGPILTTIALIVIIFMGPDKLGEILSLPNIDVILHNLAPILIGSFCVLTCTTAASISLEGKNLWILKTLPIKVKDIFKSKMLINLMLLMPVIVLSTIVLSIYLKYDILHIALMLLLPLLYSIFSSLLGLVLNLNFPNFDWKNEITVIKQSIPAFGSVMIGLMVVIIPFSINYSIDSTLYIILIGLVLLIIDIIMYIYLNTIGIKKFNQL